MKILWIDTETTGLNVERCDIIQIAGIIVINGKEQERFNFRCQPTNYDTIEQQALDTCNLTVEQLHTLPTAQETYSKLKQVLDKYIDRYDKNDKFYLAGQNVEFDRQFLQSFFEKMGDKYFMSYVRHQTVDLIHLVTLLHSSGCINVANFKLETIANYLCIEYDKNLHNAEVDIDLTRRCYCKLAAAYIKFHDYQEKQDVKTN